MSGSTTNFLSTLHQVLDRYFSLEEIRTICFDLRVEYDSLGGEGKSARIRELILHLARNERLPELIAYAARERPKVSWPPIPADLELPEGPAGSPAGGSITHIYQGDVVHGDKTTGDHVEIGNITNAQGVAIGREARADVRVESLSDEAAITRLFDDLRRQVAAAAASGAAPAAGQKIDALEAEVRKGEAADDQRMAGLVTDLADLAPGAVQTLVGLFAGGPLAQLAGGATRFVIGRLGR